MAWWPHAPLHRLGEAGAYIVTAGTYLKCHRFGGGDRLMALHDLLLEVSEKHGLRLQAWSIFSNHYHLVTVVENAAAIVRAINEFHSRGAILANRWDRTPGRVVFHQYRDTHLTFERSYLARLRYVHQNPVHHGLVTVATDYPFCSAAWFEQTAPRPFQETLRQLKIDRVNVPDEYDPMVDGGASPA